MNLRKTFFDFYWQMERFVAPGLVWSLRVYEDKLKQNITKDSLWLDIGCGHNILPFWRQEEERRIVKIPQRIVGLDPDFSSLLQHKNITNRINGDIHDLPFQDNSVNLITANMVFEHLKEPQHQLREIFRILKPGGLLLFHTPNSWGYSTFFARLMPDALKKKLIYFLQRRKEEDVFPAFYRINASEKIKTIARETGFNIKEILLVPSGASLIMIPPLALFELLWIRVTMCGWFKHFRTNIIAQLVKPL